MAAKREGRFLGEWLEATIRDAARAVLAPPSPPAKQEDTTDLLTRMLDDRLGPITEQLAALAKERAEPETRRTGWWSRFVGRG
jgi:hypothetical protein